MENRKTVCLQDMVHQNNDTNFDFLRARVIYVCGWRLGFVLGTTLSSADNRLWCAIAIAVRICTIKVSTIEACTLLTEETGIASALNLKGGVLQEKYC
jgi:hypothetical protein